MTITFALIKLATAQAALQRTGRAQCDRVSLHRRNAILSDFKDIFQENTTVQITAGLNSSVTAANTSFQNEK